MKQISIDLNKKTMNLTEEAQFKSELEDKLQILKTLETKTNFDQQKIIKIQTIIKGIKARRLYELRKSNAKLKKNAIILHRKFLNKEKGEIDRYLLVISYIKHENLLISRVIDIKNHEAKTLEIKKKLYEFFNINELRNFADIMATRVLSILLLLYILLYILLSILLYNLLYILLYILYILLYILSKITR